MCRRVTAFAQKHLSRNNENFAVSNVAVTAMKSNQQKLQAEIESKSSKTQYNHKGLKETVSQRIKEIKLSLIFQLQVKPKIGTPNLSIETLSLEVVESVLDEANLTTSH